jgi:putative SbcD/Mre11-related phosphoesterase
MDFSDLQPIQNSPVLFLRKVKILIIADLHIGIEKQLYDLGINVSSQTNLMKDRIISLCKKLKPKKIFLLGDIKHNIPSYSYKEKKDVKDFLLTLISFCEINIIPGNHDGNIKKISPNEVIIHPSDGFIFKNLGLIHGHRWPSPNLMLCKNLVFGHTHPTIMLEDRLGYKKFEPCWIKGEITKKALKVKYPNSKNIKFVVVPAFNPLCGGIAVNIDGFVGPFGKLVDINKSEVFLLNGSSLGRIQNLKN